MLGNTWPPKTMVSAYRQLLMFTLCKKSNFPHSFLRYCIIVLGTLRMPDNHQINLLGTLMFVYIYKINFPPFLKIKNLRILQSYWLTAFCPITWEPEFCQIKSLWWNIKNNMFHFWNIFSIFGETRIFLKIGLRQFSRFLYP